MIIYSHRGKHEKQVAPDNSLASIRMAGDLGYGMELDVRWASDNGVIVASHDPMPFSVKRQLTFYPFHRVCTAINLKDRDLLPEFKKVVPPEDLLYGSFVFDFELCGAEHEIGDWKEAGYPIARRYSDRGEEPSGSYDFVWFDEMDETGSLLATKYDPGQCIYVSPELHGRPIEEARVDVPWFGVCTDQAEWWMQNQSN